MQGVGAVKMPGNVPLPLYGQRRCAAVIAGLGWLGLSVQLYFNIHWALVKDLSMPVNFELETMNQFIDWNRDVPFQVIRGEGECAV